MTPAQIEGMIDRMAGIFPASNFSRNAMKSTWSMDDFLLSVDVEDARKVISLVEAHGKIPSLPEMKNLFRRMWDANAIHQKVVVRCDVCRDTGWDDGYREAEEIMGQVRVTQERYTEVHWGNTYTVVVPCACPHGEERAAGLRKRQHAHS